jgi:rare lipoprotein A
MSRVGRNHHRLPSFTRDAWIGKGVRRYQDTSVSLPYCRRIETANGPAPARAGRNSGMLCRYNNQERALKQKKQQFVISLFLGAVLSFCSVVISQADSPRSESGVASVYSTESGSGTASGQKMDPEALTAAHRTLPFGTKVRVTNKNNGRSVVVTINDRGPFVSGRVIDVTPAGARALGFSGLTRVTLNVGE